MRVITDFHLHSKYSRACSKELTLPNIAKACEKKGVNLVGTSDVTHPAWRSHMGEHLVHDKGGAFMLADGSSATRFLLSTELSCVYKRGGKTRRVHHVILFPSLDSVDRLIAELEKRGCNLKADGRPILGLDSEVLFRILLEIDPRILLIPAHAWTPWYAIFGSQSGFDSLEECFGDLASNIHAIETGLSSDPEMNRRLSALDRLFLVSNSDAHSLDKLGREANVFEMDAPTYDDVYDILTTHDVKRFIETIEFFPEEGKYHVDGHRACGFWCEPEETKRRKGLCPVCGKPLTIGVLNRVVELADRETGTPPSSGLVPYRSITPLAELIGSVYNVGSSSKRVRTAMDRLCAGDRTEFGILLDLSAADLAPYASPEIVQAIFAMRRGEVERIPGYDGEFGKIRVKAHAPEQPTML
ncbi:MAG: endonuclease Q family protein [Candidatus Uhrbacteria bacterium]|nr:endonuclease Q family protein [Candidatus Uhrbacteria bacterium]